MNSDMARPLRIQYANAWYHILNRGRRSESIFADTYDYIRFIDLLQDTCEQWNLRVAAYCLMPNHYHLLVQTPDANISRCMRHIAAFIRNDSTGVMNATEPCFAAVINQF